MREQNEHLVIRIWHHLDSQESIDLALHNMEANGITVDNVWSYEEIQKAIEEDVIESTPGLAFELPFITAFSAPFKNIDSVSREECEQIADECLDGIGGDCLIRIQKEELFASITSLCDVFLKGSPCCKCGLVINHQEGITFELVKEVLERNGASNVVLNETNYRWMKIDFEAPSIMIKEFGQTYLKDININSYSVFGDRNDWSYKKKSLAQDEYYASLKIVKVKQNTFIDYSGDDLSLDPRFW